MAELEDTVLRYRNEDFLVPEVLLENFGVFREVLCMNTWENVLSKEDREHLQKFLPKFPDHLNQGNVLVKDTLKKLFNQENFKFGSPLKQVWQQLNAGEFQSNIAEAKEDLRKEQDKLSQQQQKESFMKMFEVLFKRHQSLLAQRIGGEGSDFKSARKRKKFRSTVEARAGKRFKMLMSKLHSERDEDVSSDEEFLFSSGSSHIPKQPRVLSSQWYNDLLRHHSRRKRQLGDKFTTAAMDTVGITLDDVIRRDQEAKNGMDEEDVDVVETEDFLEVPAPVARLSKKTSPKEPMFKPLETDSPLFPVQEIRERKKFMGVKVNTPIQLSENPPEGLYSSFFALLKCIFLSMKGHKGELSKIEKKVGQWQRSSEYIQCQWVDLQPSWLPLVQSALCYLGGEVGATSLIDPVPGFMPYIEFRDRVDNWRWIGHGRDSNIELFVLFKHWLDTLDRADTVIDYSDYLPPVTASDKDLTLKFLSPEEVILFHSMEKQRYSNPHKAFRFTIHGYESAVGPLKGIPKQGVAVSKAREHFLLKSERPSVVTILSLVRDASSRLPGGEGTRAEICGLVRESQYVRDVTDSQINAAVSGALDRLHYEKDPCVRYDSSRKLWIYLHRARSEDDFERIHKEVEKAIRNRKKLMSKPVRMVRQSEMMQLL
jgi:nuclear factor related to kappa-B-binding protein